MLLFLVFVVIVNELDLRDGKFDLLILLFILLSLKFVIIFFFLRNVLFISGDCIFLELGLFVLYVIFFIVEWELFRLVLVLREFVMELVRFFLFGEKRYYFIIIICVLLSI